MRKLFLAIAFLFCAKTFFAQKADSLSFKKNAVYLEGLGNAGIGLYSLNYERKIVENKNGFITTRIGIVYKDGGIGTPILFNYISKKKDNDHFEIGGGGDLIFSINSRTKKMNYLFAATANLMYRYQKPGGRLVFRIGWTPVFYLEDFPPDPLTTIFFLLFPGASIGYTF